MAVILLLAGFATGMTAMWFGRPYLERVERAVLPKNKAVEDSSERQISREEGVDLLWEIWDILDREYVDPEALSDEKMVYGAASGLVSSLGDRPTLFVEPLSAAIMDEDMQGSFEGIGATVEMIEGELAIVRVLPNSPALEAGLQPGDVVLAVDDEPLEGKTILEAITLIRGPKGTVVRLLVQRKGIDQPFIVPVTRDKVELSTVESSMLDDSIAYIRLVEFNAVSEKQVHDALEDLLDEDPVGLVLDLRGNPGGYLKEAVGIASEFLPTGTLVLQERGRDEETREYRVRRGGIAQDVPLVVLVNGSSASASEIVAGAVQDNGRGVLIGERTFGKGSVQNTHRLTDRSSLHVTIARWYLPSGQNLDGEGIAPNIDVPLTAEDIAAGEDLQLDRAIAFLLEGK
jgi:carboxyl-terminal processing protease